MHQRDRAGDAVRDAVTSMDFAIASTRARALLTSATAILNVQTRLPQWKAIVVNVARALPPPGRRTP